MGEHFFYISLTNLASNWEGKYTQKVVSSDKLKYDLPHSELYGVGDNSKSLKEQRDHSTSPSPLVNYYHSIHTDNVHW